jgi:dCTP deaminase
MTVGSDRWISCMARDRAIIDPFTPGQISAGVTYGLSSYGYDLRLARDFLIPLGPGEFDPTTVSEDAFRPHHGDTCLVDPGSFVLGRTVEYLRIPRNVLSLCLGKSTYARCGLVANITPLEPEWEGHVTLSLVNAGPRGIRLRAGEGIAQVVFLLGDQPCKVSYRDRKGRYQAQTSVTVARGTQAAPQRHDRD